MKLHSWNVNGLRSASKKGFKKYLEKENPDILCMQEIKVKPDQLDEELRSPKGYFVYWNSAQRPGYSGTALFSKTKPKEVKFGIGIEKFDKEGRVIIAEYDDFVLVNVYVPHGKRDKSRVPEKMEFHHELLKLMNKLKEKKKKLILCGDLNVAHNEIDIARPKENKDSTGFLPIERKWMDKVLENGYIDTYRYFNPEKVQYSYWYFGFKSRERNVGWRIDYFLVSLNVIKMIKRAYILDKVQGSDHCPICVELE